MRVRNLMNPETYGSIDAVARTYATKANAEKAGLKWLEGFGESWDTNAHLMVTENAAGRFVPVMIFQGRDAAQACINSARQGYLSFA